MKQVRWVAGCDEAGRGPLAGDVVAAAVILEEAAPIPGLADSKKLSAKKRQALFLEIQEKAKCWAIARCTAAEIDRFNILQASLIAMHRAVDQLSCKPCHVLVDGNRLPKWAYSSEAIIQGDDLMPAISAASILAKVTRDREMALLDQTYPGYGFGKHKGYPTRDHLEALARLGPCPVHRASFGPVKVLVSQTTLF